MENAALFFQNMSIALNEMTMSAECATFQFKRLNHASAVWRTSMLPILSGKWPDRFTLLNRYVRTGQEPEYFTDERVTLS